ncbi:putative fatty acyl-CoA reductase CG8306 [Culicoides brevitarsis]|uniref:putative fatty acyl-CoA reductase CG8306 n=1 Tax=Culicoides brevitarsis TaxID=469753 RepID=UPI00307B84D9
MTSEVAEFYKNKNVFLTGGSGFLGLTLIEKLLRSCPDVGYIYMLIRSKRGKTVEARMEQITKTPLFERVINERTDKIFRKVIPIVGDVSEKNLGISPADRQTLIDNVHIVIHSAASLDFNQPLRTTVNINLLGTRYVMELCDQMKCLQSMVHISSAYVNSYLTETEEILYPPPTDADGLIALVEKSSDEELAAMLQNILKDHPNTYTLTKHLAEHEVNKYIKKFPCGIVRPSMITPVWLDPLPGWTNSKNGPQGFLMGASKGVVRRLPTSKTVIYDHIPVDVVVNEVLITAQHINKKKDGSLTIFQCTSSTCNPFRWGLVYDRIPEFLHKNPIKSAVWYPNIKFHSSLTMYRISAIFLHFLPAILLDFLLKLSGARPILFRLHTHIWQSLNLLAKFIFTEWKHDNKKTMALEAQLSQVDREIFYIDVRSLKWDSYFEQMAKGVLLYLNKENPKDLAAAKRKDTILYYVHVAFLVIFNCLIGYMMTGFFGYSLGKMIVFSLMSYALFSFL